MVIWIQNNYSNISYLILGFDVFQLLSEERKKNKLLRETLESRDSAIVELERKVASLMKV